MSNIQQNSSDNKPTLSIATVLSKDCLKIESLFKRCGFSKRSGTDIKVLFTGLIESVFAGANSLHDRFSLSCVDKLSFSYDSLMRFVSNCRYNWSKLMLLVAKGAVNNAMELNDQDISIRSVLMTLLLKDLEVKK